MAVGQTFQQGRHQFVDERRSVGGHLHPSHPGRGMDRDPDRLGPRRGGRDQLRGEEGGVDLLDRRPPVDEGTHHPAGEIGGDLGGSQLDPGREGRHQPTA